MHNRRNPLPGEASFAAKLIFALAVPLIAQLACGLPPPTPTPLATATRTQTPGPTATFTSTPTPTATPDLVALAFALEGTPADDWFFVPIMPEASRGHSGGRQYYFYVVEGLAPEEVYAFYAQRLPPLDWKLVAAVENPQGLTTQVYQGIMGQLQIDVLPAGDGQLVVVLQQPMSYTEITAN